MEAQIYQFDDGDFILLDFVYDGGKQYAILNSLKDKDHIIVQEYVPTPTEQFLGVEEDTYNRIITIFSEKYKNLQE